MQTEAKTPFAFDTEFGADSLRRKAEHQAAINAAFEQGRADALASFERQRVMALDTVGAALNRLAANLTQIEAKLEIEAVDVAVATGRKLATELITRHPQEEIAKLTSSIVRELRSAPHLVIRLHPDVCANSAQTLEAKARENGFEGRIVVLPDEEVALGDGRIEWADGGITRNTPAMEDEILKIVQRFLESRAQDAGLELKDDNGDGR